MQHKDGEDSRVNAVLVEELKELLTELQYPYVITDTIGPELLERVTEFLVTELQAAKILQYWHVRPKEVRNEDQSPKEQRREWDDNVGGDESGGMAGQGSKEIGEELTQLLKVLDLDVSSQVLSDVYTEVKSRLTSLPEGSLPGPLLKSTLSSEHWCSIQRLNEALIKDYERRKQMIVKRFEVTHQSFTWGERGQERSQQLSTQAPPSLLSVGSSVCLSRVLAAREDQSYIFPVKPGESTNIHKVQMGSVPDRGGRPGEIEPPMPMWEGRREGHGSRNKGRQRRWGGSGKKQKNKRQ